MKKQILKLTNQLFCLSGNISTNAFKENINIVK